MKIKGQPVKENFQSVVGLANERICASLISGVGFDVKEAVNFEPCDSSTARQVFATATQGDIPFGR